MRRGSTSCSRSSPVCSPAATSTSTTDTRRIAARTLWSSVHGIVTSGYAARSVRRQADEIDQQIELLVAVFIRGLERGGTFAHAGTTAS